MDDYIVRASAADAKIRAFACRTRDMVETARKLHDTSPVMTAALGRLLSGAAMMGVMLKGEDERLTIQIKGNGPAEGLTVCADSSGFVKGYAVVPRVIIPANSVSHFDVGGAIGEGQLRVIKDMGLKEPYVGTIDLQTGEIAEDLTYYFAVSEQVPSSVGLGVLMNKDNTVRQAGGFIIQLMPDADDETIDILEKNIVGLESVTTMLDRKMTPEDMLGEVLKNLSPEILDKHETGFRCDCGRERFTKGIISLGQKEIAEMIEAGKDIEAVCQFCNKKYNFSVSDLKQILNSLK